MVQEFLSEFMENFGRFMSTVRFADVIDIAIVAFIIYQAFRLVRETRAEQLIKGYFDFNHFASSSVLGSGLIQCSIFLKTRCSSVFCAADYLPAGAAARTGAYGTWNGRAAAEL